MLSEPCRASCALAAGEGRHVLLAKRDRGPTTQMRIDTMTVERRSRDAVREARRAELVT